MLGADPNISGLEMIIMAYGCERGCEVHWGSQMVIRDSVLMLNTAGFQMDNRSFIYRALSDQSVHLKLSAIAFNILYFTEKVIIDSIKLPKIRIHRMSSQVVTSQYTKNLKTDFQFE